MRLVVAAALLLAGAALIAFGAWLVAKSVLPAWVKGVWRWPLGTRDSPEIARLMGWSSLLVGLSCPPAVIVLAVWDRSFDTWVASLLALFLVGAGAFALGWGVSLSRAH